MTSLLITILSSSALASPVVGDAQMAIFPGAMSLASSMIQGQSMQIVEPVVSGEVYCWDELGVADLNFDIEIESIDFAVVNGLVEVEVAIGHVTGADMVLFGVDDEWDLCPTFELDLRTFAFTDGLFTASFRPTIKAGMIDLAVVGTPEISGNMSMDIEWVPDDIILAYAEDMMYDYMGSKMQEMIPSMVNSMMMDMDFSGEYEAFSYDFMPAGLAAIDDTMLMGVDVQLGYNGPGCPSDETIPDWTEGRAPQLDLDNPNNADFGMGMTEAMLNRTMYFLWADGFFCLDPEMVGGMVGPMLESTGLPIEAPYFDVSFDAPPTITIDEGGLVMTMDGLNFVMGGTVNDTPAQIMAMTGDMSVVLDVDIDTALASFVVTVVEADLDLEHFEVTGLLSDNPGADGRLRDMVEGFMAQTLPSMVQGLAVVPNMMEMSGIIGRMTDLSLQSGGMAMFGQVYPEGDTDIDITPPETSASFVSEYAGELSFSLQANDDRSGPVVFSAQLDDGPWSAWSESNTLALFFAERGEHVLSIKSRDSWRNEDPTPFAMNISPAGVIATPEGLEEMGCSCSTPASASGGAVWILSLLGLVGFRRRR